MRKNFKICTIGLTALAASIPSLTVLSSCSKSIDSIAKSLKASVLDEFYWICRHYRPTFNNRWFCDRLVQRINKMGYEAIYDLHAYKPVEQHLDKPYGYNIYFDIPATKDGQDIPNIIIQAHTDMVAKCVEGYDWSQGVIPVIDPDGIMHTKDHQTSLGADDGIGVATILAFARNANAFKHGKVRCLLTVDEEDGDSGAAAVPSYWLQDYNYFLNLDGEHIKLTGCGSGGCQQATWQIPDAWTGFAATTCPSIKFRIDVTGLLGGHSAHYMHENRINSVQLMTQIIQAVKDAATAAGGDDVQLLWGHDDTTDNAQTGTSGGTICNEIHFVIASDRFGTDKAKAAEAVKKIAADVLANQLTIHSVEDKTKVILSLTTDEPAETERGYDKGLKPEITTMLCNLINDESKEYKLYGVIREPLDPETHPDWPVTSCNIGAFRMGSDVYPYCENEKGSSAREAGKSHFYLELFGRTSDPDDLGLRPQPQILPAKGSFMERFNNCVVRSFGTTIPDDKPWKSIGYNYPWPICAGNPINLLIHEAADSFGYEMEDDIRVGWLEMGAIIDTKKDMHIGTLGPELNDVHSVNEHLDTNTLIPMFKMFIYVLSNLKA